LQAFIRYKFNLWAGNGSYVEEIWKNFKDKIFEGIKCYVPQNILNKNPYPEYYNKEVKRLKIKVRKMYNKRKFWQLYQAEMKFFPRNYGSQEEGSRNFFTFKHTKRR